MESSEIVPLVKRGNHCLLGQLMADRILPKDFLKAPPSMESDGRGILQRHW
jgi:hypothetical protein